MLKEPADKQVVKELRHTTRIAHAACEKLFGERRAQGHVRECHGDLHLGNIVLIGNEPVPFDGIEFNPALRWIDVMNEVAFLVMDLLHRKQPELAYRFLNAYLEGTGDYSGVSVLRYYVAYRAAVRAKISAIRASQAGISERDTADTLATCRSYLALAGTSLARRQPALLITHGLPGSGKTTFAQVALERLQAIRIRSDVERKRLFGLASPADSRSRIDNDMYSADATRRTYSRLYELSRELLVAGFTVIVDAAFLKQEERNQFRKLAHDLAVPFAIASMQASKATLSARIIKRRKEAKDASDADIPVLEMLQAAQEPLLPQEHACAVKFINDEDVRGAVNAPSWSRLDKLRAFEFAN